MRRMVFLAVVAAAVLLPARGILAESAADKAVAQQIGIQLKDSGQLRDYRIGVKYQDGVAWLTGTVANPQQRDTAVRLTESMDGVSHVICKLDVADESADGQPLPLALQPASSDLVDTADDAVTEPSAVVPAAAISFGQIRAEKLAQAGGAKSNPRQATHGSGARPLRNNMPLPVQQIAFDPAAAGYYASGGSAGMGPVPAAYVPGGHARAVSYDNAQLPGYAWPSYSAYPNYAALTYPRQYSPTAWPYIGPFYPYPQVPLGWRKVSLEWDDGWWFLDFSSCGASH